MNIAGIKLEQFLGTLLYSSVVAHILHLQTHKYGAHMALNDFYTEVPDIVDSVVEYTLSDVELFNRYENLLPVENFQSAIEYLNTLREFIITGRQNLYSQEIHSNIWSTLDDMLSLIDSTKYKLTKLTEGLDSSEIKIARVQKDFLNSTLTHNGINVRDFFNKHVEEISKTIEESLKREYRCVKRDYAAVFYSRVNKDFIVVFETYRPQFYIMASLPMIELYKANIVNAKSFHSIDHKGIIRHIEGISKSYIPIFVKKS